MHLQAKARQNVGTAFVITDCTVGDVVAEVNVALGGSFEQLMANPPAQLCAGLGPYVDGGTRVSDAPARTSQGIVVRTLADSQHQRPA